VSGKLAFISEGFAEIGRKAKRYRLRAHLAGEDRQRQEALARLGRSAWEAKVDLSGFAELRSQLGNLEQRAGELEATARQLEQQKEMLQKQRAAQVASFDALRQPALEAKGRTDAALQSAREQLGQQERTISGLENRLAAMAAESARLQAAPAPGAAGSAAPPGSQPADKIKLELEQNALAAQLAAAGPAKNTLVAEVGRLNGESQSWADKLAGIEAQRKAALAPIDGDLARVDQESRNAKQQATALAGRQTECLTQLGSALYEAKAADPALAEGMQAIAAIDQSRAGTQAGLEASLALTRSMPQGTMLKFWSVLVLVPVLVFSVVYGFYYRSAPAQGELAATTAESNVEPARDAIVQAFVSSPGDPSRRKAGVRVLRADILLLGSSANPAYLPQLTKILGSGEPELRAAAANAIGMIRPGAAEIPLLTRALNDPIPAVRNGALSALEQAKDAPTQLLVRRVHAAASTSRPRPLEPQPVPDAGRLTVPVYADATFLHFASDLEAGRAAFSTPDSMQKVLEFYTSKAGRPGMNAEEFTRLYFAGLPAGAAPVNRYSDQELYGMPTFVAVRESSVNGITKAACFVVVFEDRALARTGFEVFLDRSL